MIYSTILGGRQTATGISQELLLLEIDRIYVEPCRNEADNKASVKHA